MIHVLEYKVKLIILDDMIEEFNDIVMLEFLESLDFSNLTNSIRISELMFHCLDRNKLASHNIFGQIYI